MQVRLHHILWLIVLLGLLFLIWSRALSQEDAAAVPPADSARPESIIELQLSRNHTSAALQLAPNLETRATLINLNPYVGTWYLLSLAVGDAAPVSYHLESEQRWAGQWGLWADASRLYLRAGEQRCEIWSMHGNVLDAARRTALPFAPVCAGLSLRNPILGTYTGIERVTEFLRDHVWGGDEIVSLVKETAFRDAFVESGLERAVTVRPPSSPGEPTSASIDAAIANPGVIPEHLGITVAGAPASFALGSWYAIDGVPGTWLSVMRPGAVPASLLAAERSRVNALDAVESNGLDYLVAFDLAQFRFRFVLGTDHPRLDWSDRVLPEQRVADWPGPDGIGSAQPLVRTGMVNPAETASVIATFAGGFKREHGAFHYGPLAHRNHGSHYGFMEQGVVFSRLQPGLSTFYSMRDGTIGLKTWAPEDDLMLSRIVDARQNGVPLIEYDPVSGTSQAGEFVNQWGAGNWSGSNDRQLRTVRAGLCLQHGATRNFLVFGYFSAATPSAMTRVFEAYGCRYAMELDLNALEHTYFAVYVHQPGRVEVRHLAQGMEEVDRKGGSRLAPRFLGFPDDRDFFYVTRRASS